MHGRPTRPFSATQAAALTVALVAASAGAAADPPSFFTALDYYGS